MCTNSPAVYKCKNHENAPSAGRRSRLFHGRLSEGEQNTHYCSASRTHSATADDIRLFLNSYQTKKNTTNATLDNIRRVLFNFYNWLEEDDYIVKNPMKKIHKIKVSTLVKEIFSDEEIEELRNVTIHRIRDCAMQELLLLSGIRVGELFSLNRDSIDFNELSCIVKGKGDKERIAYFNIKTKVALEQYLKTRKDSHKTLFKSLYKNKRLSVNAVESIFKKKENLQK